MKKRFSFGIKANQGAVLRQTKAENHAIIKK
jgi:hypothetical protein